MAKLFAKSGDNANGGGPHFEAFRTGFALFANYPFGAPKTKVGKVITFVSVKACTRKHKELV